MKLPFCTRKPLPRFRVFSRFPLKQFEYVFSVARELHRSPSVLCFGLSHSYYVSPVTLAVFGFVVYIQRRPVVVSIPSVCVSSCGGLPPLSLIIAFGSVPWQEMRDLFYLAWTTLFLPDYWCYFTLNNMTLCSQSAQGQSLRVIDTFKSRGGKYNQRRGAGKERI